MRKAKADQLARLCHADVTLIIRRNGRQTIVEGRHTKHGRGRPQQAIPGSMEAVMGGGCSPHGAGIAIPVKLEADEGAEIRALKETKNLR